MVNTNEIEADYVEIGTEKDPNGALYENDDAEITFPVTDPDGNEVDVSGATSIEWGFKHEANYEDTLVSYTLSGGNITVDDNDGSLSKQSYVRVQVNGTDTSDLGGYDYFHRLIIVDADGNEGTAAAGPIYLSDK